MSGDDHGDLQWKGASVGPAEQKKHAAQLTMSLRDWFAGQALAGAPFDRPSSTAERAYLIADAMLTERAKPRG